MCCFPDLLVCCAANNVLAKHRREFKYSVKSRWMKLMRYFASRSEIDVTIFPAASAIVLRVKIIDSSIRTANAFWEAVKQI